LRGADIVWKMLMIVDSRDVRVWDCPRLLDPKIRMPSKSRRSGTLAAKPPFTATDIYHDALSCQCPFFEDWCESMITGA
jgi:hypothetical protein